MSNYKVVPTLQSRLGPLNKLKERTHKETPPTEGTTPGTPIDRPVPVPRQRPSSPVQSSTDGWKPVPKKRTLKPNSNTVPPHTGATRVQAYSHGSKEYKQSKKDNTGMSPVGMRMSTGGMGMNPGGMGMNSGGMGMSPDASVIGVIDLETCPSLRKRYEKNEERLDIAEISDLKLEEKRELSPDHPMETPRPKTPPPPKPPRPNRVTTSPALKRAESPLSSPLLPRSHSDIWSSNSTSATANSKSGGGILNAIKKSPVFGRKKKSVSDDIADNESVISQAAIMKTKRSPLHLVAVRNINEMLKDESIDPNGRDDDYCTPIHYYVMKPRKSRHSLLKKCLQSGRSFDLNALNMDDNTPLHEAAKRDDVQYVRILIAFGAKLFIKNRQGKYPFELAPPSGHTHSLLTQFLEPSVNQAFSLSSLPDTTNSLNIDELRNKTIGELMAPNNASILARMIDAELVKAEREFVPSEEMSSISQQTNEQINATVAQTQQRFYLNGWKKTAGNRVLFLDGGGIRGLIQIEVLMELEERTGCKITELFDWIVGTSTGGIVALGLVYAKKSLSELKQMYFQLKNQVFAGSGLAGAFMSMGPKSIKMEEMLKREMGDAPLISIQKPRVMICVANKATLPMKVQFFTNFITEDEELCNIPVWKAARATSAAPIYFTPCDGKYVDGGVKANNPCQEAMRVIKKYDESMGIPERHFLLMMSIGTGVYPVKELVGGDIDKGTLIKKHFDHMRQLVDLFTDCIGESEPSARNFEAWCSRIPIPFFRFNPQLEHVVAPGETDDDTVIDLIINTKLYLARDDVSTKLDELVGLFRRLSSQSLQ